MALREQHPELLVDDTTGKMGYKNPVTNKDVTLDDPGNVAITGGVIGGVNYPRGLVSASTSAATTNTAAINLAAAGGGVVFIPSGMGVLYINGTIVGGPIQTQFIIGAGTVLTCIPATVGGPTFPAFRNYNFNPTRIALTAVAMSLVGTHSLRITFTLESTPVMAAGQLLYVNGDTGEAFNGAWPIESVDLAAKTVTVLTGHANPTSAITYPTLTGSPYCCLADPDFQITGPGTINMNFLGGGFTASGTWTDHGVVVNNALRPDVSGIRVINSRKYCVCMQNVVNPRARQIEGRSNSDGVHIYGPAWSPLVEDLSGEFGDDGAIFQTVDGPGFLGYMLPETYPASTGRTWPGGNIYDGTMRNIRPTSTGNSGCAVLYPASGINTALGTGSGYSWAAGDLGFRFKGMQTIDGLAQVLKSIGSPAYNYASSGAFVVGGGYVPTTGFIEQIVIRNAQWGPIGFTNLTAGLITIKNVVLENPMTDTATGVSPRMLFENVAIDNFTINNGRFRNATTVTAEIVKLNAATASIGNLSFNNCFAESGASSLSFVGSVGGSLKQVQFNNCVLSGSAAFIGSATYAATPSVVINGGYSAPSSASVAMGGTQALDVHINDHRLISGALFNFFGSGQVRVWAKGCQIDSGSMALNLPSGNVAQWFNPDGSLPVDITKLARTRNQMAVHNGGTTAGTIVANNLCIADSTATTSGWKQLSNTANVY